MSSYSNKSGFFKTLKKKEASPAGYEIPHFNFEEIEEIEGIPDIDEVLEEIRQHDVVEETISSVFIVSLVLNVQTNTSRGSAKHSKERHHKASKVKWSLPDTASSYEKDVSFQEEQETGNVVWNFLFVVDRF